MHNKQAGAAPMAPTPTWSFSSFGASPEGVLLFRA